MNELALYAGGGGGLLASRLLAWRTVCYVERDPYCVQVIKARIKDGWLDDAPIWDNAKTFAGRYWRGLVDVVTGGFPCQPFSGAGNRLADRDPRNLWPATIRIIRAVRPEWCFLENVSRLITYPYFGRILGDLAASGFDCTWECLPASAVGAPHQRDRVWIVAHAMQGGRGDLLQVVKGNLSPSGHYTNNLWPTPSSRDHKGVPGKGTMERGGRMSSLPLAVMKFPTPTAGDSRNRRTSKRAKEKYGAGPTLLEVVYGDRAGGSLNPDWVEWLMGWPIGWTDLEPLAMDKFQQWRSQHGDCLASD